MWQIPILIILYLTPAASLILYPLNKRLVLGRVHAFFGRIEWVLSFLRDILLAVFLLSYAAVLIMKGPGFPFITILYFVCFGFSLSAYFLRRVQINGFIDLVSKGSVRRSGEFFCLYFASISGLPGHPPAHSVDEPPLPVDFKRGRTHLSIMPVLSGLIYTAIVARLIIRASRLKSRQCCEGLGENLSFIWGLKCIELSRARFDVKGLENLKAVHGRSVFVCNHKSFLDFTVVPLAIGYANIGRAERFHARYMAARDHFYDNQFLYRFVGMGRAMEVIGTVFVDRKARRKRPTDAVDESVEAIAGGVDIVMYPQGTRAYASTDEKGRRAPAGYYTTGSERSLVREVGHLKKGAAYLSVDAAISLAGRGVALNIIPVGIVGTDLAVPRGKLRILKGVDIEVRFGKPYRVECVGGRPELVMATHLKIDAMLKGLLDINGGLKKRLLMDIRRVMGDRDMERFIEAMGAWRSDEDLIFSIIDCIYSMPVPVRGSIIRQLYGLIIEADTPREKVLEFKASVVREMIKHR